MNNKKTTRDEHSAGGCVYQNQGEGFLWLLGKHSGYHKWVLPKGLIEPGEKAEETAVREVAEEIGVKAKIVGAEPIFTDQYTYVAEYKEKIDNVGMPIRRVKNYQESGGGGTKVKKTVTYYLMEWVEGDPENHDWEMEEAGWFSLDEALEKMSFQGEKEALIKAGEKLNENY